jgi:hypothetical protein
VAGVPRLLSCLHTVLQVGCREAGGYGGAVLFCNQLLRTATWSKQLLLASSVSGAHGQNLPQVDQGEV